MPRIVADIVDAYIFRKVNARVQFLLLLRRADAALGNTWQSIHEKIEPGETALEAAERAVLGAGADQDKMMEAVRLAVRRCATDWTGKKPVVDVLIVRV